MKRLLIDTVGLQTPAGRTLFFALASTFIFLLPQSVLGGLSLWSRLGLESAPSVGLTRAYNFVLHGNFSAAWERNSLIFLVLAIGIPIIARDIYTLFKMRKH